MRLPFFRRDRAADATARIAVMGALRSGTNVVAAMLEAHWHVASDFHAYGWKHAGVPVFAPSSGLAYPDIPIVWVCKSPHALVVSMHRYRMLAETGGGLSLEGARNFRDFLRGPITLRDSRLRNSPQMRFANPVQYWNFLTWNLETLDPARFRVLGLNYEDIVRDPGTLQRVESLLPLRRRTEGPITLPQSRMTRGRARPEDRGEAPGFDAAAVTRATHLSAFDADDLAFVAAQVDPWLMERRGYVLP